MQQPNEQVPSGTVNIASNMHSLNIDVIAEIQKELDIHDTISMVFLLYDSPDTALQQLIVLERISRDVEISTSTLLRDWALNAQSRITRRYEFLEALTICQLYSVIRKLGFHVASVKSHFLPENMKVSVYINNMKKALYKVCENINMTNLSKMKSTIKTYDIDADDYEACELVFLKLMSERFITIGNSLDRQDGACNIEKLAKIIDNLNGLKKFAIELHDIERINNATQNHTHDKTSTPEKAHVIDDSKYDSYKEVGITNDEICKILDDGLCSEDSMSFNYLETDTKKASDNVVYEIKNPKRLGVCYIINQDTFHPSKESLEDNSIASEPLENRLGSVKDRKELEKTMAALNFEVICHSNLDHKKMLIQLRDIVKFRVQHDDSIFLLCILSHGVRGHVFAADSVKVSVDSIQNFLDSNEAIRLQGIPKILVIQACQVDGEPSQSRLVADGPARYHVTKTDFLIYWATAPQLQAFRDQINGSIFVQILCRILNKFADKEHVFDLFTRVNFIVNKVCEALHCNQAPIFKSTLLKKVYLYSPK